MTRESLRQHHGTGVKLGCGSNRVQSRITVVSWHQGTVNQVFEFMKVNKSPLILPWVPRVPVCSAGLGAAAMLLSWLPLFCPLSLLLLRLPASSQPLQSSAQLCYGWILPGESQSFITEFPSECVCSRLGLSPCCDSSTSLAGTQDVPAVQSAERSLQLSRHYPCPRAG